MFRRFLNGIGKCKWDTTAKIALGYCRRQFSCKKAQSTIEYAVLISVMAAAIIGMYSYVRRAVQANLKTVERELNSEWGN